MCNKPAVKEKRRNNEKRKEKSRDAARCRRSKETEIFTDMSQALPLTAQQVNQLDKASIMRLAIAYLRVKQMINIVPQLPIEKEEVNIDESVFLKSLEGFLLVLSPEGDFVFLSENVCEYLGIAQIDLMGQNVFEYSHPCDHEEIREILSLKTLETLGDKRSFFIRLKCTLTSKGRSVNLKSATYKVIHVTGHIVNKGKKKDKKDAKGTMDRCLVAVGQPIPHPSNIEAPLPHQTFLTKHSLDMKFTYADEKMMEFLGYKSEDLIGKSVYEYHHAMDTDAITSAYKCLFSKGQCETSMYRFLAKTGGFVWVLSQGTLIYDKMQKPQSVVCVNYVISDIECKDEIYSAYQLQSSVKSEPPLKPAEAKEEVEETKKDCVVKVNTDERANSDSRPLSVTEKLLGSLADTPVVYSPRPQTATSKIFAPRTEDMNKGFLTFSEDNPGLTMLKDDPDDLTHLAPMAGDVCVPLSDPSEVYLPDFDQDLFLRDDICPLLTDDPLDPFLAYRDSCDPSPQLLSPNLSKNSDCSLPSLNSPTDSLEDEDQMSTFMSLQVDDDPELSMRAPYIPMNIGDDIPFLISDHDLMWSTNDKCNNNGKSSSEQNHHQATSAASSLAQLLCSNMNKSSRHTNSNANDHGGGIVLKPDKKEEILDERSDKTRWKLTSHDKKPRETDKKYAPPNHKRTSSATYDNCNKRTKSEPKEKISSELLQQLISNNNRGRKDKPNWLLDSGGQKATCISQPSDSVLMNLLAEKAKQDKGFCKQKLKEIAEIQTMQLRNGEGTRAVNDASILLDPDGDMLPLFDLTQQDYDVNAPVDMNLLQGKDLLIALDQPRPI